jgi:hypothetical protein
MRRYDAELNAIRNRILEMKPGEAKSFEVLHEVTELLVDWLDANLVYREIVWTSLPYNIFHILCPPLLYHKYVHRHDE